MKCEFRLLHALHVISCICVATLYINDYQIIPVNEIIMVKNCQRSITLFSCIKRNENKAHCVFNVQHDFHIVWLVSWWNFRCVPMIIICSFDCVLFFLFFFFIFCAPCTRLFCWNLFHRSVFIAKKWHCIFPLQRHPPPHPHTTISFQLFIAIEMFIYSSNRAHISLCVRKTNVLYFSCLDHQASKKLTFITCTNVFGMTCERREYWKSWESKNEHRIAYAVANRPAAAMTWICVSAR